MKAATQLIFEFVHQVLRGETYLHDVWWKLIFEFTHQVFQGEMTTGISSSSVGFFDLLSGFDPRNPDQPLVPVDMVLSSASVRTMFFHFDMSKVFVVASSRRNSSFDGLPVFARIYMLDMRLMPPASRWTPIFSGNDQAAVQIQSCVAVFDRSSYPDPGTRNMCKCVLQTNSQNSSCIDLYMFRMPGTRNMYKSVLCSKCSSVVLYV